MTSDAEAASYLFVQAFSGCHVDGHRPVFAVLAVPVDTRREDHAELDLSLAVTEPPLPVVQLNAREKECLHLRATTCLSVAILQRGQPDVLFIALSRRRNCLDAGEGKQPV